MNVIQTNLFILSNLPISKLVTIVFPVNKDNKWRSHGGRVVGLCFPMFLLILANAIVRYAYLIIFILIFIQAHKLLQKQMSLLQNSTLTFQWQAMFKKLMILPQHFITQFSPTAIASHQKTPPLSPLRNNILYSRTSFLWYPEQSMQYPIQILSLNKALVAASSSLKATGFQIHCRLLLSVNSFVLSLTNEPAAVSRLRTLYSTFSILTATMTAPSL